jgi:hypothetical protein
VGSYLSETAEQNYAHTFLSTLSRPEHREVVGELAQRVTGEAVRALVTAGAAELAASRSAPAAAAAAAAAAARAASGAAASPSRSRGSGDAGARTPPPPARTALAASSKAGAGFGRRTFSMPSPPHGAFSLADGEAMPLSTPPPCALCASSDILGGCGDATHAAHRWLAGAAAASCGAPACTSFGSGEGGSPGSAASDGGGAGRAGGGDASAGGDAAAAAVDSTWVATARLALSIAAQPEARALLRDVAGAAAGASVRAAITTLPSALCSMLPSMPFRRRTAAAAQQPAAPPQQHTQQAAQRAAAARAATPLRRGMYTPVGVGVAGTPRARLTELDADGRPLPRSASGSWCGADSDGSPRSEAASPQAQALCVSPAAGLTASARMQGALALALVVHAFAFMPHAAARVGWYAP